MDAGNDSADTIEFLRTSGHAFILKCNLRSDSSVRWLSHAIFQDKPEHPREGKEVHIGTLEHDKKSEREPRSSDYQVTCRSIDKLLVHEIEMESYWTNLGESLRDIIALYHDHGTSEQ